MQTLTRMAQRLMWKLAIPLIASLGGCHSPRVDAVDPAIRDFSDVTSYDGRRVTAVGYISRTHEATGLYFTLKDMNAENDKCIVPNPFPEVTHGTKVSLSGTLARTECGSERVCLNTCSGYELR